MTMPEATAFVAERVAPAVVGVPAAAPRLEARKAALTVERAGAARLAEIEADWRDLVGRAPEPNVFMHPALMGAAERHCRGLRLVTLLAWRQGAGAPTLVGLWSFSLGAPEQSILPVTVLRAPAAPHGYLATPVLDPGAAEDAIDAMLDFVARDAGLPKTIALDPIAADGEAMAALARVLARRGGEAFVMAQSERPMLQSDLDAKQYFEKAMSGSSRRKLRQHRRRIEEKGALTVRRCETPESVAPAFDEFLALEAAGWKGRRGSAIVCSDSEAGFAKEMVVALARRGDAAIYALDLDGKPISIQVVLRAGAVAYTWKTAYDEAFRDYSPGVLLLEDYTKAFLDDDTVARVDSCAYDTSSFMAAWWSERQAIARVWFDARRGGSLNFFVLARLQKALVRLRAVAKSAYLAGRRLCRI